MKSNLTCSIERNGIKEVTKTIEKIYTKDMLLDEYLHDVNDLEEYIKNRDFNIILLSLSNFILAIFVFVLLLWFL